MTTYLVEAVSSMSTMYRLPVTLPVVFCVDVSFSVKDLSVQLPVNSQHVCFVMTKKYQVSSCHKLQKIPGMAVTVYNMRSLSIILTIRFIPLQVIKNGDQIYHSTHL